MHFAKVLVSALLGVCASAANVFVVSVSSTKGNLTYSPNKITAKPGDMVQFQFRGGNHTVTQSTFDQPCMPISMFSNTTGIWSGFMPVAASAAQGNIPTYTVLINNTTPMWLYCSQGKHCQNGMVMVINENTAKNQTRSLQNFMALAKTAQVNLPGDATSATGGQSGTTTGNGTSTGTGSGTGSSTTPSTSSVVGASAGTILTTPATMSLFGIAAAFFLL